MGFARINVDAVDDDVIPDATDVTHMFLFSFVRKSVRGNETETEYLCCR
jgi:hypothetical protein